MRIIDTLSDIQNQIDGCVLTIGNFDGVHLGHQRIIAKAKEAAKSAGNKPVAAITFHPHPVAILHPEKSPGVLTPLPLKEYLLGQEQIDYLVVLKDSYNLLNLSPEDFVDEFLMDKIRPTIIVEGDDFNFGYGRSGTVETLRELGQNRGFNVVVVAPQQITLADGQTERASSSLVRHLLQRGDVADAAAVLGRCYRLIGHTVKGRGKGTHLGFPTANIHPLEQIIPDEGVYCGYVEVDDCMEELLGQKQQIPAVFSIGRAKTFITDHPLLIEAHILKDDVPNLLDKWLAMDFVDFIRHQQRFENETALAEQIAKDCEKAKTILS